MQIKIKNLKKTYGTKTVLNLSDLKFESGKIHGILGPNGSGKTTFMKIIGGLLTPSSGTIYYNGISDADKALKKMTYASHNPYLFSRSVRENIAYPLKIRKKTKEEIDPIVKDLLKEFKIETIANQNAKKLSGGESQKTALARALSFSPDTLLLDEPTANIDPQSLRLIEASLLKRNIEKDLTVIIITHNPSQAFRICHTLTYIDAGKCLYTGNPTDFKQVDTPSIQDFISLNL
ncbi:MAG: ABC transporter ATP-binding protein [Eubacterium sp.]